MKNESTIILQYKQREQHLLNVRQQYNKSSDLSVVQHVARESMCGVDGDMTVIAASEFVELYTVDIAAEWGMLQESYEISPENYSVHSTRSWFEAETTMNVLNTRCQFQTDFDCDKLDITNSLQRDVWIHLLCKV